MEITEVRIKLAEDTGERLYAYCSITIDDCFVIRDLRIIEGNNGMFVSMPSRKLTSHCARCRSKNHLRANFCNQCGARLPTETAVKDDTGRTRLYADIVHPSTWKCRDAIQERIIKAYHDEVARSKLPGYVSTYHELDDDLGKPGTNSHKQASAPNGPHLAARTSDGAPPAGHGSADARR